MAGLRARRIQIIAFPGIWSAQPVTSSVESRPTQLQRGKQRTKGFQIGLFVTT